MRIFLAAVFATLLAACSNLTDLHYTPVPLQDENDTKRLALQFKAAADIDKIDFAYAVILTTNKRCDDFFESLDRIRSDSNFAVSRLSAISTALPPLLKAAGVSAGGLANVAAALGFATGTINDFQQYYLLAEFKPQLYKKWSVFRKAQEAAVISTLKANSVTPYETKAHLYEYVRMCLPSQLKQWIVDASNSGSATIVGADTAPASPAAGRSAFSSLPPVGQRAVRPATKPGPIIIE